MFSTNGDGMKFCAIVEYTYAADWMLFGLWYSMQKYLPDAELVINCKSPKKIERQFFAWCKRCKVSFNYSDICNGILVPPDIIMVRELMEGVEVKDVNDICSDCRQELFTPFVSYKNGFGNFVTTDWINTLECPFPWADRFMTKLAGVNEVGILKLWKQLSTIYANVSKG